MNAIERMDFHVQVIENDEVAAAWSEVRRLAELGRLVRTGKCRTELAAYAHEAWSGWMQYQFSREVKGIMDLNDRGRWQRQMNTEYADLPTSEQASDVVEADKILQVIQRAALRQVKP